MAPPTATTSITACAHGVCMASWSLRTRSALLKWMHRQTQVMEGGVAGIPQWSHPIKCCTKKYMANAVVTMYTRRIENFELVKGQDEAHDAHLPEVDESSQRTKVCGSSARMHSSSTRCAGQPIQCAHPCTTNHGPQNAAADCGEPDPG